MNTSKHMLAAIELAKKGELSVQPNPMVGCVIVKGEEIIGSGWHKMYGSHHAEVNAINDCLKKFGIENGKKLLRRSHMFVTLEPCSITNNTPPCTNKILEYEISKVTYGAKDPNPKIFGKGLQQLKSKGVTVEPSIFKDECQTLLKIFAVNQLKKRPFISVKIAVSSDGFLAPAKATKQHFISGANSRNNVQSIRKKHRAILIGGNTLRIDQPSLHIKNQKIKNSDQPVKIILTNRNPSKTQLKNLMSRYSRIIFVSNKKILVPVKENIENLVIEKTGKPFLHDLLKKLLAQKISSILVEPGQGMFQLFQKHNLIDELIVFRSNTCLKDGLPPMQSSVDFENYLKRLTLVTSEKIGSDIKSTFKI